MNLLEYEAKQLLQAHDIPTPSHTIISPDTNSYPSTPVVLKSQVPVGGRGKLGGVKVVDDNTQVSVVAQQIFALDIKGYKPSVLLAEEKLDIAREFYLSVIIDRSNAEIQLVAHPAGGVEVEENSADEFLRTTLTNANSVAVGVQLAELYDIPDQTFVLQDLAESLYECFVKNDATLIEINPLVLTAKNELIAGDCKITLDASAAFRHPEWDFEAKNPETNFVTLDTKGNVATIANGAGLAMATVDAVADYDMTPANFLDIGGGANADSVLAAFRRIMTYPSVRVIVVNIFAGITRCDEVAKAIIEASRSIDRLPPLCIRLAGTNYDEAASLLKTEGISTLPTLEDCLQAAKEYTT